MKTIVLISANAEWRVVKELYPELVFKESPFGEFAALNVDGLGVLLFHGGWGKISASASTQYVIDNFEPDLLVNLGTCGGFEGRIETGTTILVERTLVYDIIEQMGDGADAVNHYGCSLDLGWLAPNVPHPILRGLLVSADRDILEADIPMLIKKYDAVAADWESGAIAWVAQKNKMPLLILRSVTDLVGGGGGEAYGNIELFHDRTKVVMRKLFHQLPDWLNSIKL
jgi:adenosylhomocysteine nucleosidase